MQTDRIIYGAKPPLSLLGSTILFSIQLLSIILLVAWITVGIQVFIPGKGAFSHPIPSIAIVIQEHRILLDAFSATFAAIFIASPLLPLSYGTWTIYNKNTSSMKPKYPMLYKIATTMGITGLLSGFFIITFAYIWTII